MIYSKTRYYREDTVYPETGFIFHSAESAACIRRPRTTAVSVGGEYRDAMAEYQARVDKLNSHKVHVVACPDCDGDTP